MSLTRSPSSSPEDRTRRFAEATDRLIRLLEEDAELSLVLAVSEAAGSKEMWYDLVRLVRATALAERTPMSATGPEARHVARLLRAALSG